MGLGFFCLLLKTLSQGDLYEMCKVHENMPQDKTDTRLQCS